MRTLNGRMCVILMAAAASAASPAAELLNARLMGQEGEAISFRLSGENRNDIVGGSIELGSRSFTITHVSLTGLIGGRRVATHDADGSFAEFAVFSSSFSTQMAVGVPWISARGHTGCDSPYNSFLAIYRVEGQEAIAALDPTPYGKLAEDEASSQSSHVFCFVSTPPVGG